MAQADIDPLIVQNFVEDPRANVEITKFQFKNAAFSIFSSLLVLQKQKKHFKLANL